MRISAKAEYACVAVLELARRHGSDQPVPVKLIAEQHGIPQRYLVQILLQLKGAGFVASTRGAAGGYLLTQAPETISLADIMTAIDGPLPVRHRPVTTPNSPATLALCSVWDEVLARERELLGEATLGDLAKQIQQSAEIMYHI